MKTLPPVFQKHGFIFHLVERHGDVATYRKFGAGWKNREHYETFFVQSHNGRTIAGREIPPAEHMPANEAWGQLGWSFQDREKALQRLRDLTTGKPRLTPAKPSKNDFVTRRG